MAPSSETAASALPAGGELTVEELAVRLGLPLDMLVRRIEAGTIPARLVAGAGGTGYRVQVSSLPAYLVAAVGPVAAAPPSAPSPGAATPGTAVVEARGRIAAAAGKYDVKAMERLSAAVESGSDLAREDLHALGVDPAQLVATLLDRWQRTYEQRVEADFRLRSEAALAAERAKLERLRVELEALHAELGAQASARDAELEAARTAVAECDRDMRTLREQLHTRLSAIMERDKVIAERERVIAVRDRLLHELREELARAERQPVTKPKTRGRVGGIFGG